MSYDMTKMDTTSWENYIKEANKTKRKIKYNPFYNKEKFVKEKYKFVFGKEVDLKNPKTFNEKLNSYKVNDNLMKKLSKYADKHQVKKYVRKKIGAKHIIKEYFYKEKITVEDLEKLPNQFVLKTTLGSGTNYIVKDKNKENLEEICNYMNFLTKLEYGYLHGEFLYNYEKNMIIAEELLIDDKNNIPDDLKCFCFQDNDGNKKKIIYVERVIGDERERIMFDEKWNIVDYNSSFKQLEEKIPKPKNLKDIIRIIDKLSEDFNFVRVDLYLFNNKIYFGELTFIPTAGYLKFDNPDHDIEWGSWIGNNKEEKIKEI